MDFLKKVGRSLSSLVSSPRKRRSKSKKPAAPGTPPPAPAPPAPAPPAPVPPPAKGGKKMRMSNLGKLVFYKPKRMRKQKATRKAKSKSRKGRKSTRRR